MTIFYHAVSREAIQVHTLRMQSKASAVELWPILGLPEIQAGVPLASVLIERAAALGIGLRDADVLVIAQKVVSKAEGRRVRLAEVVPTTPATELAKICGKDARLVELVLQESTAVVRCVKDVLIVRHRLGFVVANAGIDQSNVEGGDEHALLLPVSPDQSALVIREAVAAQCGISVGIIVNDSFGRPWRRGTCGVAIGCAGIEALIDLRGRPDRFGRRLRTTEVAAADEMAAAASLLMGQADEGVPAVILRGLAASARSSSGAATLIRSDAENLFK